ncbi:hypothetical protein [Arthrobacter agilis]|jgi:hypothetical protein|uniref:hypothetical protein n=1 Tax=Arthrobacter agilis TaxID=37921 RepID=UPI002785EF32|nr:hypothetical protein [Arthrobacter agilis]MDQ0736996.1 hypothetical protein [Arthrobacter agilis]
MAESLAAWSDFNVAMVGATAALAGLLIVAMSVNISAILDSTALPARAAAAIGTLTLAIVVGAIGLAPAQPAWAHGLEVLAAFLVVLGLELHAIRLIVAEPDRPAGERGVKLVAGVLPLVPFAAGAALLLGGVPVAGLAWLAVGCVLAIVGGIMFSWVALVEVLR